MPSRVFIIDDQGTNRRVLASFALALGGVSVSDFADPAQALEQARLTPPDLVITDFNMPGMDGAELIRRLRARPDTADVPVIVVTAFEDREIRRDALEAGATDFLLSPVDGWEFRTRARNLLTLRAQQVAIARQTLRESEERFRLLVESVEEYAILMLDAEGRIVSWNSGAEKSFRHAEGEVAGRPFAGLVASLEAEDLLARAASEGRDRREGWLLRKGGARFCADVLVTRLGEDAGSAARFAVVTRDLTESRRMERALREALGSAQTLLRELQHRVRNNLQVIATMLRLQRTHAEEARSHGPLLRAERRVQALGLLFHHLRGPEDITTVDLAGYLEDLGRTYADIVPASLEVGIAARDLGVELDSASPLAMLVEEMLHRALEARTGGGAAMTLAEGPGGHALRLEWPGAGAEGSALGSDLGEQALTAMAAQIGVAVTTGGDGALSWIEAVLPETLVRRGG